MGCDGGGSGAVFLGTEGGSSSGDLKTWETAGVTRAPLGMSIWLSLEALVWNSSGRHGHHVGVPHPLQDPKRYGHKQIWLSDNHNKGSCIISQGQAQNRNNLFLIFLLNTEHITLRRSLPTLKELGTSPTGQHFPTFPKVYSEGSWF